MSLKDQKLLYIRQIMMIIDVRNANKVNLLNMIGLLRKAYQTLVNKGYTLQIADMIVVKQAPGFT